MRVALLSANAPPANALGNQLADKVAFFLEHGVELRVFLADDRCLHPIVRPHAQHVPETPFPAEAWQFLTTADLVLADFSQYYPLLDWLPLLAGTRTRLLLDYHGITPPALWPAQNREPLERAVRQRGLVWFADAVLAHSRFTCRELLQTTGLPCTRLRQLGYAIDTDYFTPGRPRHCWRERLGLKQAVVLLFVGRLAPNKRVRLLVEALGRLRDQQPPVHAVVIGDATDLYEQEAERCRSRAAELGVAERLHLLGQVSRQELRDAYRSADVFVMPSLHEGFCIPVLEAQACGLPVVAARTSALPETMGAAGLTFTPDDAEDLAAQVSRLLHERSPRQAEDLSTTTVATELGLAAMRPMRVVVVACRYGPDVVGGAETSLRTIAEALHQAGHQVEVFTTCCRDEDDWRDSAPPGTSRVNGLAVHSFPVRDRDAHRYRIAQQQIDAEAGAVSAEIERDFLEHSLHSEPLLAALRERSSQLDAIIVGPYLFGLTYDVARSFPEKTLLLPCFHDEPAARLPALRAAYALVGGILYHSPEEQTLAESELGLNHPGACCLGTVLDREANGQAERGRQRVGTSRPYVLYCGRYSPHKNLPLLLDYARHYATLHPDRFTFVFSGRGSVTIPAEPWARDLGPVEEQDRRDLLAGASVLVQLSCLEALSLVALEAWVQGIPVIAHRECAVLAGHLRRSGGGRGVASFAEFAAALDDLWERPEVWREWGRNGQVYVRTQYGSRAAFTARLEAALRDVPVPLRERMRRQGLQRVQDFSRSTWRQQFGRIIDEVLHAPPQPVREHIEVQPRLTEQTASLGLSSVVVPVRVHNRGSYPLLADGPARTVLRGRLLDQVIEAALPGMILPGQSLPAALVVPVPRQAGTYSVICWAERHDRKEQASPCPSERGTTRLVVETTASKTGGSSLAATVRTLLESVRQNQELPTDYVDVTAGWFAPIKRWIKRKLLNNFKRAYVEVAFRQQASFNRMVGNLLQELVEYWAIQEHVRNQQEEEAASVQTIPSSLSTAKLVEELANLKQQCAQLQNRLTQLETLLAEKDAIRS